MPKKRGDFLAFLGLAALMIFLILLLAMIASKRRPRSETVEVASGGGQKIAVVEMVGPIYGSERMTRQLKSFGEQKSIKAIVLRIESPGGTVASAQEIYNAVRRIRKDGKPVVVSMGDVAASGGYYVACGADTIMANPGTTTGSIGVVAEFPSVEGLLEKIGVQIHVIKSGDLKDTGSPFRPMTDQDRAYLQSWVNDAYDQFVNVVVEERKLPKRKVLELADGRVFTGRQAKREGLVDLLGDYEDAVALAAKLGGIKGKPTVVKPSIRKGSWFDLFFQESERVFRGLNGARLMYKLI